VAESSCRAIYISPTTRRLLLAHAAANLPGTVPFSVNDLCPSVLEPKSVCQIVLNYASGVAPSDDAATLTLDQGRSVLLTGEIETRRWSDGQRDESQPESLGECTDVRNTRGGHWCLQAPRRASPYAIPELTTFIAHAEL
jgi:hypothetical protein